MRLGTILMLIGGGLFLVGLGVRMGLFSWFGHLPGDIDIQGERSRVVIPLGSMILISVVITILVNLIGMVLRNR